jgi:hypothetical protein
MQISVCRDGGGGVSCIEKARKTNAVQTISIERKTPIIRYLIPNLKYNKAFLCHF